MEEVYNDGIHGQAALFVFPCHIQDLLLVAVAQFALPVTETEFRHHGAAPGSERVVLFDLHRSIAGSDIVIQFFGAFCIPFGFVGRKGSGADGRIVPEEAIAAAGDEEGNGSLGVAVSQLEACSFLVQMSVLVLAHAEDLFVFKSFKTGIELKVRAAGIRL